MPIKASFQGPNAPGAESVKGFLTFLENSMLSNRYPKWWLKTLPVKSFKLACDGWARSIAAQNELVQEAMESYSASTDAEEHTFLEQWVEQGMSDNEIAHHLAGMTVVATDTVSLHGRKQWSLLSHACTLL